MGAGRVRGHALKQSAPCHQQHVRQQAMVMMTTPTATPATKPTFAMLMDWKGRPEQPEPEHAEMAWQLPSVLWARRRTSDGAGVSASVATGRGGVRRWLATHESEE
jgi:hypothetical protein